MSITKLIRPFLAPRYQKIERYTTRTEEIQMRVLQRLLTAAANTEWGRRHQFRTILTYEQFASSCPVTNYDDLKADIDRMRHGERDVLWPGRVQWYHRPA